MKGMDTILESLIERCTRVMRMRPQSGAIRELQVYYVFRSDPPETFIFIFIIVIIIIVAIITFLRYFFRANHSKLGK